VKKSTRRLKREWAKGNVANAYKSLREFARWAAYQGNKNGVSQWAADWLGAKGMKVDRG
jgi:hypothetical protein